MYLLFQQRIRVRFTEFLRFHYGIEQLALKLEVPPSVELGEVALPIAFDLAKRLKRAPRAIAQEIVDKLGPIEGVEKAGVAGAGYINLHFQRSDFFRQLAMGNTDVVSAQTTSLGGKVIIEHTNINPNKAAHIGHLRNAVLGDSFVRFLRALGRTVEVQNYIDNTGVQVADVIVGFEYLQRLSRPQVKALIETPSVRFDYYCWDLYARVSQFYVEEPARLELRSETLHKIEAGGNETAALAELVATTIVRAHIATMSRVNVQYDLLPRESDILHLKFWETAFSKLKDRGALIFEEVGKNKGCWVMKAGESEAEAPQDTASPSPHDEDKIIVRSNGTVTYVGKDIAYQLWKFGLLGKDFFYEPFHTYDDGHVIWMSSSVQNESSRRAPAFGHGTHVFNVIDVRQSYLQNIVVQGLRVLGFHDAAERSVHFDYEMVALSPQCCRELGIELSEEDQKRPYIEVSGRKGLGVKADDLIDTLIAKALSEVEKRQTDLPASEQKKIAHQIAVGGLRYFLLKYTLHSVIAFDFDEALSFEGETGPYLQYAVVRAQNIFRKLTEENPTFSPTRLPALAALTSYEEFLKGKENDEVWGLVLLASQLNVQVTQAVATHEPATIAKYAFNLAQAFNNFYHKHRILPEPDPKRKDFLLSVVYIVQQTLESALNLLGIQVPERM